MTNLHGARTRFAVVDSGNITGTKCGNVHGYQQRDGKIHCVTLSDTAIIPGLDANLFSTK